MKPTDITLVDFVIRLGVAAVLGIAIGFERQWRQRAAGLHTSSLVAIGAALFALLDTVMNAGDTTRIVAGVVTGVGFIAGGVILKSGSNISGLNTAATMWATAAIGALAGFGLWSEAAIGALVIIALNLLLQPIADAINLRSKDIQAGETVYTLSVLTLAQNQGAVSDAILRAISASPISLRSLTREHTDGGSLAFSADIVSPKPNDAGMQILSATLLSIPGVTKSTVSQRSL